MNFNDLLYEWREELVHTSTRYFIVAGAVFFLFYIVFRKWMLHRKIQAKFPNLKDYRRDIFYSIISMCIFATIAMLTFTILKPYTNMYDDIAKYGKPYYYFSFLGMFLIHDTYFYWTHRFMHLPKVYQYVHLIHHKSTNPSPWTAYAFHPLEAIAEAGIIPLIAFTLPVQQDSLTYYFLFQIGYNVYGHLGFEIFPANMSRHWLGKFFNTSVAHNMHHKYFVKNYGLWTTIWDRLMGTLHPKYEEMYEQTTKRSPEKYTESAEQLSSL